MAVRTQDPYGGSTKYNQNGFSTSSKAGGVSATVTQPQHTYHQSGFSNSSGTTSTSTAPRASTPTWGGSLDPNYGQNNAVGGGYSGGYSGGSSSSSSSDSSEYYGGGGGGGSSYDAAAEAERQRQAQLEAIRLAIQAQMKARQSAIDAANKALDEQGTIAKNQYETSRAQVGNDYQDLRNKLSVNNFKARRNQREALADRGAFNSGNGMQENLTLSSNYNNNMNKINTQEQSAYNTLLNNLNSYLGQINLQKANNQNSTLDNFNNVISSLINATYSGYTPSSDYLTLAQSIAGNLPTSVVTPSVATSATGISNNDLDPYNTLLRYGLV